MPVRIRVPSDFNVSNVIMRSGHVIQSSFGCGGRVQKR